MVWVGLLAVATSAVGGCVSARGRVSDGVPNEGETIGLANLIDPEPDIPSRDLLLGVGGRRWQPPDSPFRLAREDPEGASRKLEVIDRNGMAWNVKFGEEARPEVTASRLLWAVGYHQSPEYYVPRWVLEGGSTAGVQEGARFRPELAWRVIGHWEWRHNPFVGSRELRALVVFMGLINNWDLKASQNVILERPGLTPRRIWIVGDLGAAFGGSGWLTHSKDDLPDFAGEPLVRGTEGDHVDLALRVGYAREWGLDEDIEIDDVVWLCQRLERLTEQQWRDAFRAGGYSERESAAFVAELKRKVQEGLRLAEREPEAPTGE